MVALRENVPWQRPQMKGPWAVHALGMVEIKSVEVKWNAISHC